MGSSCEKWILNGKLETEHMAADNRDPITGGMWSTDGAGVALGNGN